MDAITLALNLLDRGFDLSPTTEGRLIVKPASLLTDQDRQAITQHRDALIRLVSADYSDLPDGWQPCPAIPSRVVLVRHGRLLDSVCFPTAAEAADFVACNASKDRTPTETRPSKPHPFHEV